MLWRQSEVEIQVIHSQPAERLSGEAGREPSSAGYPSRRRRGRGESVPGGAGRYGGVTAPALPVRFVGGRLPGCVHRPAYRGDCGVRAPDRKPFPASRVSCRPVGRRPGFRRAGGAAGAVASRRAAYRRLRGRGRTSRLAGLSRRYVSRGPGAAGPSRRASSGRRYPSRPFVRRGRRDCSGSTRIRYRRDTAGELNPVIGAVARVGRVCSNEVGCCGGSGTGARAAVEWAVRVSPGFRSRPSLSAERRHVQTRERCGCRRGFGPGLRWAGVRGGVRGPGRAGGAAGAGPSRRAACRRLRGGGIRPVARRAAATARRARAAGGVVSSPGRGCLARSILARQGGQRGRLACSMPA